MEATAKGVVTLPISTDGGRPRISVEHLSGDVKIVGWEAAQIQVRTTNTNDDFDLEDLFNIRQTGNDVEISLLRDNGQVRRGWRGGSWDIGGLIRVAVGIGMAASADLLINVPYSSDLRIRTASGDIEVENVDGKISIASASGDIEMASVAGNVLIRTASGDVDIDDFAGRLGVHTMSGDLKAVASELIGLNVGSASGDVDIAARLSQDGEYEVQSISGDISLALPVGATCTADLRTVSGDLRCRLPHESNRRGRREQHYAINGGDGPALRFSTTSGDVTIEEWTEMQANESTRNSGRPAVTERLGQLDAATKARVADPDAAEEASGQTVRFNPEQDAPTANAEQAPRRSQMEVLEAIERGEMSVEDGLKMLNG